MNGILREASSFFAAELDRPTTRCFDSLTCSRIVSPVEPICVTLAGTERGFIAARGYLAAKTRPACARRLRDELLASELVRIREENYSFYGVRKMHAAMRRAGWEVGLYQIARLVRKADLRGVIRGRKPITTTPAAKTAGLFPDLVGRRFTADAPNRLWVADITFVATWSGFAYVAFMTDAFSRKIIGWNVSSRLTTESSPWPALDMASWAATHALTGLVHHADNGVSTCRCAILNGSQTSVSRHHRSRR